MISCRRVPNQSDRDNANTGDQIHQEVQAGDTARTGLLLILSYYGPVPNTRRWILGCLIHHNKRVRDKRVSHMGMYHTQVKSMVIHEADKGHKVWYMRR